LFIVPEGFGSRFSVRRSIFFQLTGYFTDAELLDRISFDTFPIALTPTLTLLSFLTTIISVSNLTRT